MLLNPVSVLPLPVCHSNSTMSNSTTNYPVIPPNGTVPRLSFSSSAERKYYTLLPSITGAHMIEDDLKYKLNKCAFDSPAKNFVTTSTIPINLPTPSATPTTFCEYRSAASPISPSSGVYNSGSESSSSASSVTKKISKRKRAERSVASEEDSNVAKVEQRRRHVCKICSKGFTTSGHLARHNRIHTGEKNHFCPFEGCNQRFSRHDNCIQHYRTHLRKK